MDLPDFRDYFVGVQGNSFSSIERLPPTDSIAINAPYERLYRVMARIWAQEWVKEGKLRISLLSSYREESMRHRRDAREGQLQHAAIGNNLFAWEAAHSLSIAFARIPLRLLNSKFDCHADDCNVMVDISNPQRWLPQLDRAVRAECQRKGCPVSASVANDIAYCDIPNLDFGPAGCPINCVFVKPHVVRTGDVLNHYWLESEARAIWQSESDFVDPVHVHDAALCQDCRIMPDDELLGDEHIPLVRVRRYGREEHSKWLEHLGHPIGLSAWQKGNSGNLG